MRFVKRQQKVARNIAENAVFPIPLKLAKVLTPIEVKRLDEEIYKVIDSIVPQIVLNTCTEVEKRAETGLEEGISMTSYTNAIKSIKNEL